MISSRGVRGEPRSENLAAFETYILTAAQLLVNSMLLNHEKPAVLSAVMKYETTSSRARKVNNDAMDVAGGSGICRGLTTSWATRTCLCPSPSLSRGANILTRSLMIFGQGVNRAHPNLIPHRERHLEGR
jgi:acyl-CoA dehydrogenase